MTRIWLLRAAAIGALVAIGAASLPPAAQANEWYNDYTVTGLPEYITAPTPFSVTVDGPDAVCSMTYGGASLSAPPWDFTASMDPSDWRDASTVLVALCDGNQDYVSAHAQPAFSIYGTVLSTSGGRPAETRVQNNTPSPAVVTVTNPHGKVVATQAFAEDASVLIPSKGLAKTTTYLMTVVNGEGLSLQVPIILTKGWGVFGFGEGQGATMQPCSTITWAYSTKGQPGSASTLVRDIAQSLARLSKETGLKFVRTDDVANARLKYGWRNLGKSGPSGLGGTDGSVTFNSRDEWPRNVNRGFGLVRGYLPGRGWLVIHETMHTMGFDHVYDETQVMNPIGHMHSFGTGDLEGLHTLYPRAGCGANP